MKGANRAEQEPNLTDKSANQTTVTKPNLYESQWPKSKTPKPRSLKLVSVGVTAAVAVGSIALAAQQAQAFSALNVVNSLSSSGGVGVSKDILYGDAPLQDLDMYYPKPLAQAMQSQQSISNSYPMVVFVHGGSWESGSKEDYAFVGQSFAQAGYITAVINYRKAPEHVYPDYVKDTAQAIAWSYDNAARFHANPQRLAVVGHSAGAFNMIAAVSNEDFLATYGMKPSDISAVVGIAGPYSYDFRKYGGSVAFAADATPDEVMPDRQIKGKQPPYLLLTAENDKVVYDQNTIKMTQALKEFGATVENSEIKGASHATSIGAMASPLRWVNDVRAQVLRYLDKELN
ncbi:alpha/beta hydrolase [Psychrobacter frigidicola]|uniref:Alpha/beta hydrolase n=1 Tax=Psychrobacter frigidicola TaxID=45611 RepID=A0A5C6ZZR6_9GAMM|nr:alpha/beta hydrolase [Psychrobacter frigidicola]TXD96034.1 alpha/beta hydrolase [Psychrobacter frigidicola]